MFQKLKAKFSKPKLSREERILKLKSDFKASLKDTLSLFFKSIFAIAFTFLYVILGVFVVRFLIPLSIMTVYYSGGTFIHIRYNGVNISCVTCFIYCL